MRSLLVSILLLATVAPARAQSDVDAVTLRDGAILRGHVAEIRPNQSVTIVLLTGETRVVRWSDFVAGSGPSFPGTTLAPPPQQPAIGPPQLIYESPTYPEQAFLKPGPGRVPLMVESATGKKIFVGVPIGGTTVIGFGMSATAHRRLCDGPCTLYVPTGNFTFNTTANDVSYDTDVDVGPRGVRLKMRTPSRGRSFGGIAMVSSGGALGIIGGTLLAFGGGRSDENSWYGAGGALLGVGVGLLAGGIYLLATNTRGIAERQDL
jgi:hypothetical protein